jgi:hypothetical protein
MGVVRRTVWNGEPPDLHELLAVSRVNGTRARCALWSHEFGWELKLDVDGTLVRSHVTRDPNQKIDTTANEWRAAMVEKGWVE